MRISKSYLFGKWNYRESLGNIGHDTGDQHHDQTK